MTAHTKLVRSVPLIPLLLASLAATAAGATPAEPWANALKPAGNAAAPLTIVADGAPRYAVLLPVHPTAPEQKAAAELQHWLRGMTGVTLPVAPEDHKPGDVSRFV